MSREKTETVGITLRVREELRLDLEQAARAKRISLNQEVIERLEYVRGRRGLLTEILSLFFGEQLAGLLLTLGLAVGGVANSHRRLGLVFDSEGVEVFRRPSRDQSPTDWIDDPTAFNEAVQAVNILLEAARPKGEEVRPGRLGRFRAGQVIDALGSRAPRMRPSMPALPDKEIEAIKDLLGGPVVQRMTAAWKRRRHVEAAADEIPVVTGRVVDAEEREDVKAKRDD